MLLWYTVSINLEAEHLETLTSAASDCRTAISSKTERKTLVLGTMYEFNTNGTDQPIRFRAIMNRFIVKAVKPKKADGRPEKGRQTNVFATSSWVDGLKPSVRRLFLKSHAVLGKSILKWTNAHTVPVSVKKSIEKLRIILDQ